MYNNYFIYIYSIFTSNRFCNYECKPCTIEEIFKTISQASFYLCNKQSLPVPTWPLIHQITEADTTTNKSHSAHPLDDESAASTLVLWNWVKIYMSTYVALLEYVSQITEIQFNQLSSNIYVCSRYVVPLKLDALWFPVMGIIFQNVNVIDTLDL